MVNLVLCLFVLIFCAYFVYKMNKLVNIFIDFIDDKIGNVDDFKNELIKFKKYL